MQLADYRSVDVVIPVFNGEKYLSEAIASVLAQDYPVARVIVVDDGSTDGSVDIARQFPSVEILQQPNQGPAAARNRGIQAVSAKYIAFLDADDRWLPDKTGTQLEALAENPQLDMVFGGMDYFYSPDLAPEDYPLKPKAQEEAFVMGTLMARRDRFLHVGLLPTNLVLGEFIAWYNQARVLGLQAGAVDKTVMERRLHANNYTRRQGRSRDDYLKIVRARLRDSRRGEAE